MLRFSRFLLLALLFPVLSNAQSNYQPGLIVNLQGDTVRGFIDYHEWENSPKSILFKSDAAATPQNLTPQSVKYFNIFVGHDDEYGAYMGPISTDNTEINHLSIGRDSSFKQDTAFVRVLQHGKNLLIFSFSDNQKTRFFIAHGFSDKPVELVYRIYWNSAEANGRDRTAYENDFKGQLYQEAVKAGVMTPALKNYISKADYREEELLHITSMINGISETDASKNNPSKHPKTLTIAIIAVTVLVIGVIIDFASIHNASR